MRYNPDFPEILSTKKPVALEIVLYQRTFGVFSVKTQSSFFIGCLRSDCVHGFLEIKFVLNRVMRKVISSGHFLRRVQSPFHETNPAVPNYVFE